MSINNNDINNNNNDDINDNKNNDRPNNNIDKILEIRYLYCIPLDIIVF